MAPTAAKFGKQIQFADRRGIPYVWFPGEPDTVKDIRSGEQVEADAADLAAAGRRPAPRRHGRLAQVDHQQRAPARGTVTRTAGHDRLSVLAVRRLRPTVA